jgi:hypothetical protein
MKFFCSFFILRKLKFGEVQDDLAILNEAIRILRDTSRGEISDGRFRSKSTADC